MKLLVLILSKVDHLEHLMQALSKNKITGGTILESFGMAKYLAGTNQSNFFSSLKVFLDPKKNESKTLLFVQDNQTIANTIKIIKDVIGDLNNPDTGIIFTIPIDYSEGVKF